ncbi:DUF4465 domain-containing protein [Bacteroidia bacterium]|nr:DUF4465 domain-containing protein [Bacteroidia bacterium]
MKKTLLPLIALICLNVSAQKTTATFEDLLAQKDTFLNGITTAPIPRVFKIDSNLVVFNADFDTSYGGYWRGGFAVSSMTDTMDASFANLYSSANGKGANNSQVYLVGNDGDKNPVLETLPTVGSTMASILSLYVSNTTYAYRAMKEGNRFSTKFSARNKDSFVLWIFAENANNDSMRVDLADFTHSDTTKNFILDSWVKVSIPFPATRLRFKLVSSDNGSFVMNTPAFFAIDNIELEYRTSIEYIPNSSFSLYPNPANNIISIDYTGEIMQFLVYDINGKLILQKEASQTKSIDISKLDRGVYLFEMITSDNKRGVQRFIKE